VIYVTEYPVCINGWVPKNARYTSSMLTMIGGSRDWLENDFNIECVCGPLYA
jgi:hypothetical protein